MTLERGAKRKILGVKAERGYPKNPLRFAVTAAVIMQNISFLPECRKPAFLTFRKVQKGQTFSGKNAPEPPTLLCNKRQFYPTKMAGGAGGISIKLGYVTARLAQCHRPVSSVGRAPVC